MTMEHQENNRRGFRISDRVALLVRSLNTEDSQRANSLFESRRRELMQAPDSDPVAGYKKFSIAQVQKRCPEVYDYMSYLEEKLEKLEHNAKMCESVLPLFPSNLVSLSISGIQFHSEKEYLNKSLVEIAIRLFPSQIPLLFFARIMRCELCADSQMHGWSVGASYTHINAKDEEILARHIHQYQMDALSLQVN